MQSLASWCTNRTFFCFTSYIYIATYVCVHTASSCTCVLACYIVLMARLHTVATHAHM